MTDTLVVCRPFHQELVKHQFPNATRVVPVGAALVGHRFDEIIVMADVTEGCGFLRRKMIEQWFVGIRCRLKPGGKMHVAPDVDFD